MPENLRSILDQVENAISLKPLPPTGRISSDGGTLKEKARFTQIFVPVLFATFIFILNLNGSKVDSSL